MSDLNIALGNQAESGRFTDSDALIKNVIALYNVANVVVTGHSLGGSLAMHCLELNPKIVTHGVVFNPGKGLDGGYFDQVDAEISTPITTKWYNYLTTYRVGGSSSWPLDDDPVSVLSGGVGDCRLIQGPGVPAKLKAHSSSNWDTTGVTRAPHTAIVYPTRR
jgi:pimeloyl-ACP methyl ester carboxylesterase